MWVCGLVAALLTHATDPALRLLHAVTKHKVRVSQLRRPCHHMTCHSRCIRHMLWRCGCCDGVAAGLASSVCVSRHVMNIIL